MRLDADLSTGDELKRIDVELKGGASGLTGLPPGAQDLVGPAPTVAARTVIEPNGAATFERLELVGTGLRLEGNPRLGLADHSLGGELRLTVPDVEPLQAALAQPIAGDLGLSVTLGGTLDIPQVGIDGTANRVAVADQTLDRVTLTGNVAGPIEAPSGSVRLAATQARQQIEVASDYRLVGEMLNLTGLKATAPATKVRAMSTWRSKGRSPAASSPAR